jgi:hypothetical protein
LLGDDVALLDLGTGEARPAPRRVSMRHPSREQVGDELWTRITASPACEATSDGYLFHPSELDGVKLQSTRLVACVFLARLGRAPMTGILRPLPPAQAALAMLPYSNLIRRRDAGALIPDVGALAARLAAFDLQRASLADMVIAVERAVEAAG